MGATIPTPITREEAEAQKRILDARTQLLQAEEVERKEQEKKLEQDRVRDWRMLIRWNERVRCASVIHAFNRTIVDDPQTHSVEINIGKKPLSSMERACVESNMYSKKYGVKEVRVEARCDCEWDDCEDDYYVYVK
jgi:hypothetical protein